MDAGRRDLLENAVLWLLTPEVGNCSASGQALLMGQTTHAGITITATPNGGVVTTGFNGSFNLTGLFAGTYTLTASAPGWSTEVVQVTLGDGENLTGVSFVLSPTATVEPCRSPALPILDNATVSDIMTVDTIGNVSAIEVYVNLTHTYRGDLSVTLTSPQGTAVVLHNRTGSSADNLIGWYPTELTPAGNLGSLVGQEMSGPWTLTVSDGAGGDTGTFNQWCLRITYGSGVVAVGVSPLVATAVGDGMQLSWDADSALADGYNVYRRVPGLPAVRLNDALLDVRAGGVRFVDPGVGLAAGQTVYYSFALVRGGVEIGFSEEVMVAFASGVPGVFALRGNYPNPFNPSTTIRFDLPKAGHVRLDIYDVAGRLVRTLIDGNRTASAQAEIWDGTDNGGRAVSSGVYYYRVRTETSSATAKMLLLK